MKTGHIKLKRKRVKTIIQVTRKKDEKIILLNHFEEDIVYKE